MKAYRQLRKHSRQTRIGCVRFQLFVWISDIKWWPSRTIMQYRLKRLAKRHPEAFKRAVDQLKELLK